MRKEKTEAEAKLVIKRESVKELWEKRILQNTTGINLQEVLIFSS